MTVQLPFHGVYGPLNTIHQTIIKSLGVRWLANIPTAGFYLFEEQGELKLFKAQASPSRGIGINFLSKKINQRTRAGFKSQLAKSLGLNRRPESHILDTTCGFGSDSAVLAHLGIKVSALERAPALQALLLSAWQRLALTKPKIAQKLEIIPKDSQQYLKQTTDRFDVIYIDPMFDSPRRKAKPQQALLWLSQMIGIDSNQQQFFELCCQKALQRVVVKSHSRMQPFAQPSYQIHGKAVRFDIYLST